MTRYGNINPAKFSPSQNQSAIALSCKEQYSLLEASDQTGNVNYIINSNEGVLAVISPEF